MTIDIPEDSRILRQVLKAYQIEKDCRIESFGTGLINHTWKIYTPHADYILQEINTRVFTNPNAIADNIIKIKDYLRKYPDYYFVAPIPSVQGDQLVQVQKSFYRLFPFVPGSHSVDVVSSCAQASQAAYQFGKFTRLLSGLDADSLNITLPHFHDLSLRYSQFVDAHINGNKERIARVSWLSELLFSHAQIVKDFDFIVGNPEFKKRVTHHDTKISNVLFNPKDEALCVIDLDTVMPGYFISDLGDMIRTYVCPVSEEEQDFSKIIIREDYYFTIIEGYNRGMEIELTEAEKNHFFYAGKFMIYMQALRFLTDYLLDDIYYGAAYDDHNLNRAQNQTILLQKLIEKEAILTGKTKVLTG